MIIPAGKVTKVCPPNANRNYIAIQNLDSTSTNTIYLLQQEAEAEVFINQGFCIGGLGLLEMQNCLNMQSKKAWYAYTSVAAGVDVRVLDI